jgi:hypothetical protein
LKGGTGILQPGSQEDLNQCNQVLGSSGKREPRLAGQIPAIVVAGGEGELVRKVQGTKAELVGGDVMVGVDRRGWNDGDPRWR